MDDTSDDEIHNQDLNIRLEENVTNGNDTLNYEEVNEKLQPSYRNHKDFINESEKFSMDIDNTHENEIHNESAKNINKTSDTVNHFGEINIKEEENCDENIPVVNEEEKRDNAPGKLIVYIDFYIIVR